MRLVDTNDVYNVLTEYYHHKTATQHMVLADALSVAKTVDAIPVDWIESYLSDCAEGSIVYYAIKQMLKKWREERNGKSNQC